MNVNFKLNALNFNIKPIIENGHQDVKNQVKTVIKDVQAPEVPNMNDAEV